jgi:hypothetical protein
MPAAALKAEIDGAVIDAGAWTVTTKDGKTWTVTATAS